jgi:hypothetical protein
LDGSGLDASGLFALLRMLTGLFGIAAVLIVPLLVPLNYVHDHPESSARGLDKFSCLNILENHIGRLWAHLVAAYLFTGLFCLVSRRELGNFVNVRNLFHCEKTSRAYLITDIPKGTEKAAVESMFNKLFASEVQLYTTGHRKMAFVAGERYHKAMTWIEGKVSRAQLDRGMCSDIAC